MAPSHRLHNHQSEGGCTFRFDFSKVYWNSRLGTEHGRLVSLFQPSEIICDAFAGVGPFAVPAGKKGCGVMASDLNPESAKGLRDSIQLNRVRPVLDFDFLLMDGDTFWVVR
jgi:tRNA (guanine37-N1)-methyltransferase